MREVPGEGAGRKPPRIHRTLQLHNHHRDEGWAGNRGGHGHADLHAGRGDARQPDDPAEVPRRGEHRVPAADRDADESRTADHRPRIYVTDITQWPEVARAHAEFFGAVRPATSMVEVRRLISPQMLVEIEAGAVGGPAPPEAGPP